MPSVPPPALVCPAGPSRPLVNAVGGEEGETLSQDPETAKEELASDRFRERSCAPRRRRRRRERGRGRPRAAVTEPNDAYGPGSPR